MMPVFFWMPIAGGIGRVQDRTAKAWGFIRKTQEEIT
jgi:hypothetical protein